MPEEVKVLLEDDEDLVVALRKIVLLQKELDRTRSEITEYLLTTNRLEFLNVDWPTLFGHFGVKTR